MLIMILFTFAINERIICNSTQTIKLSEYRIHSLLEHTSVAGKSKWQPFPSVLCPQGTKGAEFAAFVIKFYLPKPASGLKDAKMGGTADFGYDIIYGSHIVRDALQCLVQVTGVQEKANCAIWLSCNHSRVNPWRDSLCNCSMISACRSRWQLARHLAIGLGLAPGGGVILGKFSGWFLCDMGRDRNNFFYKILVFALFNKV